MPNSYQKFLKPTEHLKNLQLLEEISKDSAISQRKLSQRLDLALGVTNACLKKMVNKGMVEVKGINHKRIAYYLTPKGFAEKTKLAYHFLEHIIKYYSNLKNNISDKLSLLCKAGHRRIVCYGAGEVMEVVCIILNESDLRLFILAIVDDNKDKQGKRMFGSMAQEPQVIEKLKPDAVLVTSIKYKDKIMNNLKNNKDLAGVNFYSLIGNG